jgi:3-dehydrosphinganine reductase
VKLNKKMSFFSEKAVTVIKENVIRNDQRVEHYSLDLSQGHDNIKKAFDDIENKVGDIYMLVNCAGMAICGTIEDTKPEDAQFLIDLNYFGTFYPIQCVLPKMKEQKDGIIVLTSSQGGLMGIYGLGAYSAAKFAVRGLAEALAMETKHLGINVTLCLPADTDTPGFANEQKSKPKITQEICSGGGLFKPEEVGKRLLEDALKGHFFSILGFESWILSILCVGMAPWKNPLLGVLQCYVMGPLRLISFVIQWNFSRIVKQYYQPKEKSN